jgi:hypothetical protein
MMKLVTEDGHPIQDLGVIFQSNEQIAPLYVASLIQRFHVHGRCLLLDSWLKYNDSFA